MIGLKLSRPERAVRASRVPVGAEHEVVNDKLTSTFEERRQCLLAVRSVENVVFGYLFPGQFATLLIQFVTQSRELFFLR
jgi:hypothetical protein